MSIIVSTFSKHPLTLKVSLHLALGIPFGRPFLKLASELHNAHYRCLTIYSCFFFPFLFFLNFQLKVYASCKLHSYNWHILQMAEINFDTNSYIVLVCGEVPAFRNHVPKFSRESQIYDQLHALWNFLS